MIRQFLAALMAIGFLYAGAVTPRALKRQIVPLASDHKVINPLAKKPVRPVAAGAGGVLLWESFENTGSVSGWIPQGWTFESHGDPGLALSEKWGIDKQASVWLPAPADGKWYAGVSYCSDKEQDEWMISPVVEVAAGTSLSFYAFVNPLFLYVCDGAHVDFDNSVWKQQEITSTLQILVKEEADGAEWVVVKDFAQEHLGEEFLDLQMNAPEGLEKFTCPLTTFEGKQVRIAIRYVGRDGDTVFVDAVKIALPEVVLEMMTPFSTQYYGLLPNESWSGLPAAVAVYPAYADITFSNYSWNDGASYWWEYSDPATKEYTRSDEYDLTVAYRPDYTSEASTRNNLYLPPVLHGQGASYSDAEVKMPVAYIQAGGHPEWADTDGNVSRFGLLPFDVISRDIGFAYAEQEEFGKRSIPMFGYSDDSQQYWTEYTFGEDAQEGDYCKVTSLFNYIYPSNSPLVVDGAWVLAYGEVSDNAMFNLGVYPLVDVFDQTTGELLGQTFAEQPIAVAHCAGSAVTNRVQGMNSFISVKFTFANPVVLDDSHAAYAVKLTGFADGGVTYFAPMQSWKPEPSGLCLGWVEKEMSWLGTVRNSITPLASRENEYGEMFASFAIVLDGYYPWMEMADGQSQSISFGDSQNAQILLDTYFHAHQVEVEAPQWIEAKVEGRHASSTVTLTAEPADSPRQGTVTLRAPGFEHTFTVSQDRSGLESVISDKSRRQVTAVYGIDGRKVDTARPLLPGVYVVRYNDGTVEKRAAADFVSAQE